MGLPAEKIEPRRVRQARPRLKVVPRGARPARKPRAARQKQQLSPAAELFRGFCVVFAVLAVLAGARVWLSAQAAQASFASGQLREEIKSQRFAGDMLEIQLSQLAAPSRVAQIAGKTMGMAAPATMCYLHIASPARPAPAPAASAHAEVPQAGVKGAVSSAMKMAAGEAQVLLVGDVGLASSR